MTNQSSILCTEKHMKKRDRLKNSTDRPNYRIMDASILLLKAKNFHFTDGEILVSLKECGSILTGCALVRVIQVDRAVFGIWCIYNTKIMATSKCGPIITVAVDCIPLFSSHQR